MHNDKQTNRKIVFQICGHTPFVNLLLAPCGSDSDCATGYKCDNGDCKRGKLTKTKFLYYIKYNVTMLDRYKRMIKNDTFYYDRNMC